MKLFSQRMGLKPLKSVLQIDSIDDDLRNGLWNALHEYYWSELSTNSTLSYYGDMTRLCKALWHNYFKRTLDTLPLEYNWAATYKIIRDYFFSCEWYEVYDFIGFVANNYPNKGINKEFMYFCNEILKRELSAYRFVGSKITKITAEEEISEIEEALQVTSAFRPVHEHLSTALNLLADRKSPDYRNSIKESISSIESFSKILTGNSKATLGQALKLIEGKVELHGALKSAFNNLYGYTSDADGIRHALLEESNLDFEDAKFMLVSCSAFVNYLIVKASKAGIKL